ncbi:DNA cytosine methyltransferase [Methylobacterium brachythecii]|uniref:DNA (cytosine-5-)-methyltransferase n=1 Tax=Methylobacterium brachythecii TaxID=1176177 RepID=A0A7W6ASC1_9HYPH|nr:DNA cytosine methyltransferase [Methylobacterium brachythecii]MBB3905072.1 DNA (cytosine-5)-methyltransferase 1 [Methylobacterium brachythecii]GLS44420.1 DNA methyltransferase [Methylobacterium brachythecii]
MRPLIIDSFAGGGGASEGIRAALGRDPDYALNHDRLALAMHRINHPDTHHIEEDVWNIDARSLCAGRPVGLLWMSPDCKHFSKAKGGKPREKEIRGLAWVGVRWIKSLPKAQRPRVVFLENVEEFQDWGPLLDDGKPCPLQRGATFRSFVAAFRAMGYAVEWRELRACDYGAPTIRKRLFLVARRDGRPIVWPEPTHGAPTSEGVLSGRLKPWRTAAEIIDWSLPCPSIFETSAEIKAKHGIRANRPLADATMARIAKGTMRYVVNSPKPFLVSVNHGDSRGRREYPLDEPANTMTASRGEAIVTPFVSYGQQGGGNRDAADPLHTITASPKDQNAVVAPFVTKFNKGSTGHSIDEPVHTITTAHSDTHPGGYAPMGVVAPVIVNVANGQTTGRAPNVWPSAEPLRTVTQAGTHAVVASHLMTMRNAGKSFNGADEPAHTVTAGGAGLSVVGACLVPRYGERPGQDPRARAIDEPAPVIVPTGNEGSLAAVHMTRQFGASVGSAVEEPVGTITAGGAGKAGVVAAFLAQHNTERGDGIKAGSDIREPVSTITSGGGHQTIIASHMLNLRGSDRRDGPIDAPAPTSSAGGNHAAAVYAFLAKYYGEGLPSQVADEPLHTVTAKPRHGVVTVIVQGQPYAIVDIGMRMLTPRERFSAQCFRTDYVIDRGELEDGTIVPLTLEQQGRMCGNSVCPDMADALVAANYREDEAFAARPVRGLPPMTLFSDQPLVAAE